MDLLFAAESRDVPSSALTQSISIYLLLLLVITLVVMLNEIDRGLSAQRAAKWATKSHVFFIITYNCYELNLAITKQGV